LRAIADEDRRERYGLRPAWLEAGGLAQSASTGLVMIRAIGRGTAEVVPLNGAEPHWVKLKDLSPPGDEWWRNPPTPPPVAPD
jgi:hypothetical protein